MAVRQDWVADAVDALGVVVQISTAQCHLDNMGLGGVAVLWAFAAAWVLLVPVAEEVVRMAEEAKRAVKLVDATKRQRKSQRHSPVLAPTVVASPLTVDYTGSQT